MTRFAAIGLALFAAWFAAIAILAAIEWWAGRIVGEPDDGRRC